MIAPAPAPLPADGWACREIGFDGQTIQFVYDPASDDPLAMRFEEYPGDPPIDLMLSLVHAGTTFVDAGAHLGSFALFAAARGARIAAVEANPWQASLLAASGERSGFTDFHVVHAAVNDGPGTVAFVPHGPWGHVAPDAEPKTTSHVDVAALAIDDLVGALGWPHVDLVKLDIEGWEPHALRGMQRLIARDDAPLIIYESNESRLAGYGREGREVARVLEGAGYRRFLIDRLRDRTLVPVTAEDLQIETAADYLAVKGPLPPLGAWTIAAPDTPADVGHRVVSWCQQHVAHRCHIASALRRASPAVLAEPQVRETLKRLRQDPEARRFARWSAPLWRRVGERAVLRTRRAAGKLRVYGRRLLPHG